MCPCRYTLRRVSPLRCQHQRPNPQRLPTACPGRYSFRFYDFDLQSLDALLRHQYRETISSFLYDVGRSSASFCGSDSSLIVVNKSLVSHQFVGGGCHHLHDEGSDWDTISLCLFGKEYFEIPWAQLRSMVEPSFAERTLIKHSEYLTDATIITSHASKITNHEVQTTEGRAFPYDYLVVATGHPGSTKINRKDRLRHFQQDYEKIKSSNSILIIGGGPTGVELAGEIAVDFPEKKVTIVHKGPRLLEFISPKASRKTFNWLVKKKVEVILGQTVDLESVSEGGVYVTSSGEKIYADCHFVCVGKPVASSWLHDSILKQSLNKKGQLMVDANLRVKGRDNIFAIGDITDIPELKQGFLAEKHASVVAKNLQLLMKGAPEKKLATYTASPPIAMVSLGRKEGVAQFPFGTLFGCLPGKIKSKDLFVGKTRKTLGLKST